MMTIPFNLAHLVPARGRLLVQPLAQSSITAGGIHLAETAAKRSRPHSGLIVAIGAPNLTAMGVEEPWPYVVGQWVQFGEYSGQDVTLCGYSLINLLADELYGSMAPGTFEIAFHEPKHRSHLAWDLCELCDADENRRARERLEDARRAHMEAQAEAQWKVQDEIDTLEIAMDDAGNPEPADLNGSID